VTGANVLVALFSERESYAVYFLQQQDMSRLDADLHQPWRRQRRHLVDSPPQGAEENRTEERRQEEARSGSSPSTQRQAKAGKVDPLIVVCRSRPNRSDPAVGRRTTATSAIGCQ
jgi:ATP-dependent Clp protease ATP-binding subunit ClpA